MSSSHIRLVPSLALFLLWPATTFARMPPRPPKADTPQPPVQDTSSDTRRTVSLDVTAGDLQAVVAMLERQVGVKASVLGEGQLYKPVYVHLENVPLPKALRTIAAGAGARVIRNESGVYIFSPLSTPPPLPASFPKPSTADYHWHTLVLQHATPSDILKLMHWDQPTAPPAARDAFPPLDIAPPSPALPTGVLRIFALQSNNSLLVEATDEGFATVTKLVQMFDVSPKQVQFKTLLVAVPATRVELNAPDADAAPFLTELLRGERRVIPTPLVTTTDGVGATISFSYPPPTFDPPTARLQLVQAGPLPAPAGPATRGEFRVTPRINADGTLTLRVAFGSLPALTDRTLRGGEWAVYEMTGPQVASGERLFFFLRPTILGESGGRPDITGDGQSVTVTP